MDRIIILITTFIIMCVSEVFADTTHVVAKGESIESISKKFNVSQEALIKANPGIDKLFYIGLKLNIPEKPQNVSSVIDGKNTLDTTHTDELSTIHQQPSTSAIPNKDNSDNWDDNNNTYEGPGIDFAMQIKYGFLKKPLYANNRPFTYAFTIGVNYWFTRKFDGPFAGAMIGYDSSTSIQIGYKIESHFISIPLCGGYSLSLNSPKFGITPYMGVSSKFCIKSTMENDNGDKLKYDKNFAIDFNLGIALRVYEFNIFASYTFPLTDDTKDYFGDDAYFGVGIGFGF